MSKITFCTTNKNYTKYLKEVYISNLEFSKKYDCNFVLVNYNSEDDMDEWVKENLNEYINSGVLKYFHTTEPKYMNMSKSRNISHNLADGEILCNLDADNILTDEFMEWVLVLEDNVITEGSNRGGGGRVVISKENFLKLGGYDESIKTQQGEHFDLVKRAEKIGIKRVVVPNKLLKYLCNSDEERYKFIEKVN